MNEAAFVQKREANWQRLTELTDRTERSPAALSQAELDEFLRLYRMASADLAQVRTQSSNEALTYFLNDMVARAYGALYVRRRSPIFPALLDAIAISAQTVRKRIAFVALSAFLFFGSWLFTYGVFKVRPDVHRLVASPTTEQVEEMWTGGKMDEQASEMDLSRWGMYASNNPKVAIVAGAVSVASFGVGTSVLLVQNGFIIGDLTYAMDNVGKAGFLLGSIFPHGVPELSGIVVSGAAGFVLGWALISPGRKKRGDALREAGKDAIVLMLTSVALMFIAAPIEAFFSFNPTIPMPVKVAVIVIEVVAWAFFWTGYGRTTEA